MTKKRKNSDIIKQYKRLREQSIVRFVALLSAIIALSVMCVVIYFRLGEELFYVFCFLTPVTLVLFAVVLQAIWEVASFNRYSPPWKGDSTNIPG